jgi:hypothetical protein
MIDSDNINKIIAYVSLLAAGNLSIKYCIWNTAVYCYYIQAESMLNWR